MCLELISAPSDNNPNPSGRTACSGQHGGNNCEGPYFVLGGQLTDARPGDDRIVICVSAIRKANASLDGEIASIGERFVGEGVSNPRVDVIDSTAEEVVEDERKAASQAD